MKASGRIYISLVSALVILLGVSAQGISTLAADKVVADGYDTEVTLEQLTNGVTIVLSRNEDGTFDQTTYYGDDALYVPQIAATADGVLEWAKFHLGFVDWNDDTGRLYYTISADEPMSYISGNAYVRSTSILFPEDFFNQSFSSNLYGSMNTGRTLHDDVDTGDEEKVRIGFSGVTLTTVAGEKGSFSNSSQVVER